MRPDTPGAAIWDAWSPVPRAAFRCAGVQARSGLKPGLDRDRRQSSAGTYLDAYPPDTHAFSLTHAIHCHSVATGLSTFFVLPATPTTMYIARDGAGTIASCSTNGIHNCQSVVDAVGYRNNYGVGEQGVYCITGEGEYLYTRCGAVRARVPNHKVSLTATFRVHARGCAW